MRTGFTGTQRGMTARQLNALRELLRGLQGEWHHGDCTGADEESHDLAVAAGLEPIIHPPINPSKRAWKTAAQVAEPLPYLDRNRIIVSKTERLIAAPSRPDEITRSGTWYTVRYARKLRRPVTIILPNGRIINENP